MYCEILIDRPIDKEAEKRLSINKIDFGKEMVKSFMTTQEIMGPDNDNTIINQIICIMFFKGFTDFLVKTYNNSNGKDIVGAGKGWMEAKNEFVVIYPYVMDAIRYLLNKCTDDDEKQNMLISKCINGCNAEVAFNETYCI